MSQFPDMNQPAGTPNPFSTAPGGYPPPKKSNVWLWVLAGAGGAALLVCCGCGGFSYFVFNKGMAVVGEKLVTQLNNDETAKEHLGQVTSAKFDPVAMVNEAKNAKPGEQPRLLFHVKGDKASGDVTVEQVPGQDHFQNAKLRMPGGEEITLGF